MNDYFDLCISVNGVDIFCHAKKVCHKSDFIKMIYDREQGDIKWPPINTINIFLPQNLSVDGFEDAIKYLYDNEYKTKNIYDLLNVLIYLLIDFDVIKTLITHNIDCRKKLTENQLSVLSIMVETYGSKCNTLLEFYGHELSDYMGKDISNIFFYSKNNENTDTECWVDIPSLESDNDYCDFNFQAFGIEWVINRFEDPDISREEIYKIYVNENEKSVDKFSLKIIFYIFSEFGKSTKRSAETTILSPQEYKWLYMRYNQKENSLFFSRYGADRIRISMHMKKSPIMINFETNNRI